MGELLKNHRTTLGITQEVLGAAVGLTAARISQMEKSAVYNTDLTVMLLLQRRLGLDTLEDLMGPAASRSIAETLEISVARQAG